MGSCPGSATNISDKSHAHSGLEFLLLKKTKRGKKQSKNTKKNPITQDYSLCYIKFYLYEISRKGKGIQRVLRWLPGAEVGERMDWERGTRELFGVLGVF